MSVENRTIGVVGLGYVGLPVAVAFGKTRPTIGFDINETRIQALRDEVDTTGEVTAEDLRLTRCEYTSDPEKLRQANFIIVAVPTPIDSAKQPDLTILKKASETVGRVLKKGDIVVYESTVYPGCTEEVCQPILERLSGLTAGKDFNLGYSPERINPGDKEHTFTRIKKVVAGDTPTATEEIAAVYGSVVTAGVFKATTIKVAEAAKVIENTQRDLNIALMNELAMIFDRMDIRTQDVLEAASTKWNFLGFKPGLVGGHCIGVDPYYLTHKAQTIGYQPEVILAGRRINDHMGRLVVDKLLKLLIRSNVNVCGATVTVFGFTFKEDCPDTRNTRVIDIVQALREYGIRVQVADPVADPKEVHEEYGLELIPEEKLETADAVIIAVSHRRYREWNSARLSSFYKKSVASRVLIDVKGAIRIPEDSDFILWSL